jgi:hypothetical protein
MISPTDVDGIIAKVFDQYEISSCSRGREHVPDPIGGAAEVGWEDGGDMSCTKTEITKMNRNICWLLAETKSLKCQKVSLSALMLGSTGK